MKKMIITYAILQFLLAKQALVAHGQNTSGTVWYDETIKFNINTDETKDAMTQQIMAQLPREQKQPKILYFTENASLFENVTESKKEGEAEESNGGVKMVIKMDAPNDIVFTDIKHRKVTAQRDFMSRKFLVTDDGTPQLWRLTGNQKTILNYPCQEAVLIEDHDTTTAWFTSSIPVSTGPHGWNGLPGMILEASQNHRFVFKATKVILGNVDTDQIKTPEKGKKMTRQEFKAMVKKKQQEMNEGGGEGNNVIIKVQSR